MVAADRFNITETENSGAFSQADEVPAQLQPCDLDRPSPLGAAVLYAQRGWRVIWAPRGQKYPAVKDWPDAASTDIGTIVNWWVANPCANICVATGRASGIFVVDVDDKDGRCGSSDLAALEREHGDLPWTYTTGTGSGGVHHYFNLDGVDFALGNSVGKPAPGLDIRAEGGQVVAPPSVSAAGPYVVLLDIPSVPAPVWLVDLLRPSSPRPCPAAIRRGQEYEQPARLASPGRRARRLAGILDVVVGCHEGARNIHLYSSAGLAARMVADGELTRGQAEEALVAAALGVGLTHHEAIATIRSAFGRRAREHGHE